NRCIKARISSDYPCSVAPANGDAAKYPCPWNAQLAGPMPLLTGDYMSDIWPWPAGPAGGKDEKFLITAKTDLGGGVWELELMRWAACDDLQWYSHINGGGLGNTHFTGWVGYMSGTGMCAGAVAWLDATDVSHTFYLDTSLLTEGHSAIGPAPDGMYATVMEGAASRLGPIPGQLGLPPTFTLNIENNAFAGVGHPAGEDIQSYPNLGQWN